MIQYDKSTVQNKGKRKQILTYMANGFSSISRSAIKAAIAAAYALAVFFIVAPLFTAPATDTNVFAVLHDSLRRIVFPACSLLGFGFLCFIFGIPFGFLTIQDALLRAGLRNHIGEPPLLLSRRKSKDNPHVTVLEFDSNGVALADWIQKQAAIETALNVYAVDITQGNTKSSVLVSFVSGNNEMPKRIDWRDSMLCDGFKLALGENQLGQVSIDLSKTPHSLIGGSSGSGKSILLKLLLMQCVKKNAMVYIADLKGGVDFNAAWHLYTSISTNEACVSNALENIVSELERRKVLFVEEDCANIDEYNENHVEKLKRMVFACDEAAELLDRKGRSKDDKERLSIIERHISTIARQGRAFGIHLILATQRPDAEVITGQIKSNLDVRICGRADKMLSQIVLDNSDAAEQISKNSVGRFLTNNGEVFQGYWFNQQACFAKRGEGGVSIE